MFHQPFGTLVGGNHCRGHAGEYVLATWYEVNLSDMRLISGGVKYDV